MKLPLRVTIATAFALFAVVVILTVAGINFLGGRDAIRDVAGAKIEESTKSAQRSVDLLMGRMTSLATSVSQLPAELYDQRNLNGLLSTLTVALQNSHQIYGVFVGFPDGGFVQSINLVQALERDAAIANAPADTAVAWRILGPITAGDGRPAIWRYFDGTGREITRSLTIGGARATYDPRVRPWFIADPADTGIHITDPYIFASLQEPGVTVSKSVSNAPGATVGIDLSLADLAAVASRLQPGPSGALLVLDEKNRVLADSRWDGRNATTDLVDVDVLRDRLVSAARLAVAGTVDERKLFQHAGFDYIAIREFSKKDTDRQWELLSIARLDDYTLGLNETLYKSIGITGVVFLLAVMAVVGMAGWISKPVVRLQQMANQITDMNLSQVQTFTSPFEEVKQLQSAMERMRLTLDTFLRFVPRDVVRQLVRDDGVAEVGGVNRPVTLLFTDVAGFTTITEKMTPEQIGKQVSVYFERMSFAIQANRGTIDKFIGDAVMAMWNAPVDDPDHVDNACRATLAARQMSEELNQEFADEGLRPMRTRFGLHVCDVLVGNVGAPDRMQYTCLGSGVNLAARIEGLNKYYGTQILASDLVRRKASRGYLFRRVDLVLAKGTTRPLPIYELMGEQAEDSPYFVGTETVQRAIKYEQAFDFYLHRDFDDALRILDQLDEAFPGDTVVEQLADKCRGFIALPPPDNWNGATLLDSK